jgi:hypothetical protein
MHGLQHLVIAPNGQRLGIAQRLLQSCSEFFLSHTPADVRPGSGVSMPLRSLNSPNMR